MSYRIVLTKSATKELDGLPDKVHDNIVDHLKQLQENPRIFGAEKLTSIQAYKLRVGKHRIIYQIDDKNQEVKIIMVEDRKEVYKRIRRK